MSVDIILSVCCAYKCMYTYVVCSMYTVLVALNASNTLCLDLYVMYIECMCVYCYSLATYQFILYQTVPEPAI